MDANTHLIDRHLAEHEHDIGTEPGDACMAWQEPDEDCPKPWRCFGDLMDEGGVAICDVCGREGARD